MLIGIKITQVKIWLSSPLSNVLSPKYVANRQRVKAKSSSSTQKTEVLDVYEGDTEKSKLTLVDKGSRPIKAL
ncbi:hypothetical protein T265_04569 [Opisthorchis viverrini]|uniref:Uncharacterized protein n=1 Tax=Opisthorchis viverrini TaxID=6198 RepID=A0A074ZND3_OPIVI|nr:hypothetical protein T265_04569 [Opisthorchis viverrini]KER28616.1 hypothetical protein T265_04569 [Opisthorchis viverrini]